MLKFGTLHWASSVLSLAGSVCFLWLVISLTGAKPISSLLKTYKKLRLAFLGVNAPIRRLAINAVVAIIFFILGRSWQAHQYALGLKSEKARELEKWKREYGEYQRVYTAWLKQHQELNPPGGDQ